MKNLITITLLALLSFTAFSQEKTEQPKNKFTATFTKADKEFSKVIQEKGTFEERLKEVAKNARITFLKTDVWKKHRAQQIIDSIQVVQMIQALKKTSAFKQ